MALLGQKLQATLASNSYFLVGAGATPPHLYRYYCYDCYDCHCFAHYDYDQSCHYLCVPTRPPCYGGCIQVRSVARC